MVPVVAGSSPVGHPKKPGNDGGFLGSAGAYRWYRVEVPSKGFAFGLYRAQDQQIELDGDRPLRAIDDMLVLDLEGIDDVSFNARAEQVAAWTQEKKAKALNLVVVFKPAVPLSMVDRPVPHPDESRTSASA